MGNQFVTYEIALKLKELGFNEKCFGFYRNSEICGVNIWDRDHDQFHVISQENISSATYEFILAPLWQQAFEFFRKECGFYVYNSPEFYKNGINFNWQILWYLPEEQQTKHRVNGGTYLYGDNGEYPTQESADEAAILKMIELTTK